MNRQNVYLKLFLTLYLVLMNFEINSGQTRNKYSTENKHRQTLELKNGNVIQRGRYRIWYPESNSYLVVRYVADELGYRAKYKVVQVDKLSDDEAIEFDMRLSVGDLKSLAG